MLCQHPKLVRHIICRQLHLSARRLLLILFWLIEPPMGLQGLSARWGSNLEVARKITEIYRENPVLSQPTRLSIMIVLLMKGETSFSDLQRHLTAGNLGSRNEKLEKLGYIRRRKGFNFFRCITYISPTEKGTVETLKSNIKSKEDIRKDSEGEAEKSKLEKLTQRFTR